MVWRRILLCLGILTLILALEREVRADRLVTAAVNRGDVRMLKRLLAKGEDINSIDRDGRSVLMQAARKGREDIVRLLLQHGAEVDTADSSGITALMLAAKGGHNAVIRLLLGRGARINSKDTNLRSVIDWAKQGGHQSTVALLNAIASRPIKVRPGAGTGYHIKLAISSPENPTEEVPLLPTIEENIRLTLDQAHSPHILFPAWEPDKSVDVILGKKGTRPLITAVERGELVLVVMLLQDGVDVNQQDRRGQTALMHAAASGYTEIAKQLLHFGADVNLRNLDKETALGLALRQQRSDVVNLLLAAGAKE